MGEFDAARSLRQPVGEHPVERYFRPRPRHPELREAGDIDEAGADHHHPRLFPHAQASSPAARLPFCT